MITALRYLINRGTGTIALVTILLIVFINNMTSKVKFNENTVELIPKQNEDKKHPNEQENGTQFNNVGYQVRPQVVAGERGTLEKRLPTALIIGVNKCGTGALRDMMSMHPQIAAAASEVQYFNEERGDRGKGGHYDEGLEWYRQQMPDSYEDQITLEKSPQYFTDKLAPHRIYNFNPKTKLILMVREPVTRLISQYSNQKNNHAHIEPFEDLAIDSKGKVNNESMFIIHGVYWTFLEHYLEFFPRDQILVVNGDEFIQNPLVVIEEVETFLNIRKLITTENLYFDEAKGFYCMRSDAFSRCLGSTKGNKHEEIKPELISLFREFYAPHNTHFYELTGIDFKW